MSKVIKGKEVPRRCYGSTSISSIRASLSSKKPFLIFLELLLIWVSRWTTCSMCTLGPGTSLLHGLRAQFCRHIHERRAPSNSSQICHLQNRTILDSIGSLRAIQVFNVSTFATLMPLATPSHPLTLVL